MTGLDWFHDAAVRPYVFVRKENRPQKPGSLHQFQFQQNILVKDPFEMDEADFATQILRLENRAFASLGLVLPRWAFYDCSLMPGMVVGFAMKTTSLPESIRQAVPINDKLEYTPVSLFICIPTNEDQHWVAHNLCSVSSLLESDERWSKLGFLTKAFGLWYFNIKYLYGMTQWGSSALKVHTHYGRFQVVSAYNVIHDYPDTLTYKVDVDSNYWTSFMNSKIHKESALKDSGIAIDPEDKKAMQDFHRQIQNAGQSYYLRAEDFAQGALSKVPIYV